MKIAQYGTAIVVMHVIVHGLHGFAHNEIPVSLSLLQGLFVGVVVILAPIFDENGNLKDEAQQTSILQLGSKLATVTAKLNLPV